MFILVELNSLNFRNSQLSLINSRKFGEVFWRPSLHKRFLKPEFWDVTKCGWVEATRTG